MLAAYTFDWWTCMVFQNPEKILGTQQIIKDGRKPEARIFFYALPVDPEPLYSVGNLQVRLTYEVFMTSRVALHSTR